MILVQKIVDCRLTIKRIIDNKEDIIVEEGKGYYKKSGACIVVFFSNNYYKYKYIYENGELIVICNNSEYRFKEGLDCEGKIKNGEYVFILTTHASKIDISDNCIILDYSLYQNNLIGNYYSKLSFN